MASVRIVKRTNPCGSVEYVIQEKHFLFFGGGLMLG
jgi:hypothetical protein